MVPERRRSRWQLAESAAVVLVALSVVVIGIVSGVGGWIARIPEKTPTPAVITGSQADPTSVASRAEARAAARESVRAQVASAAATRQGADLLATLSLVTMAGQPAWAAVGAVDVDTGERVLWTSPTFDAAAPAYTASVVKVLLAEAWWMQRAESGEEVTDDERDVLHAMLAWSSNPDADTIYEEIGGYDGLTKAIADLGLTQTVANPDGYWGLTRTTVDDMLLVLGHLTASEGPLGAEAKEAILADMADVASDQDWGVGQVGTEPHVKNGWLDMATLGDDEETTDPGEEPTADPTQDPTEELTDPPAVETEVPESWLLDSIGIVTMPNGHRAQLVVLSQGWETQEEGIPLVEELAGNLIEVLQR